MKWKAEDIVERVKRPEDVAELMKEYWKSGRCPLSAQLKKGLAKAYQNFNNHDLLYCKENVVKDVLFLIHAKPLNEEQERVWNEFVSRCANCGHPMSEHQGKPTAEMKGHCLSCWGCHEEAMR